VLAEHRLERCLAAADRVVALVGGRVACDAAPEEFLEWAAAAAPTLSTPGARLLAGAGLHPAPGVKRARSRLREHGLLPDSGALPDPGPGRTGRAARWRHRGRPGEAPALAFDRVWYEVPRGPAILRGLSLQIGPDERVALMGRNGAGKSTLLRHAAGLMRATRGEITTAGRVALLLQNPTDYLVHDTVAQEAPARALEAVGLDPVALGARHPRDLSGGEKQRLALAIVMGQADGEPSPAVLCLDEPTRGMDRGVKDELASLLRSLSGTAVVVATHDPEFVAAVADRVVLLADGAVIADGPVAEVLSGGTYFATETARILGGAGGALLPEDGVALIARAAGGVTEAAPV
jgi:energy-coupling factor transport system ATP-binding protein